MLILDLLYKMALSLTSLFKKAKVNATRQMLHKISFNQEYLKKAVLIISLKGEVIDEVLRGPISEALKWVGQMVEKHHPSLQVDFYGFSYFEIPQIRHFRYRISSQKRLLWLTYEFNSKGDFVMYYDFLEEFYDTYPCLGKEWIWGTDWLPDEYRGWNERTPCLIMDELINNKVEDSYFCNLIFDNLMMASIGFINTKDRVFRVIPKQVKRTNGTVLTPEMDVIVTTQIHTSDPFYNGAKEVKEAYMRLYGFDYKKACCSVDDFEFKKVE